MDFSIDYYGHEVLSRKDDIESLAYTIFELYASKLPWSHRSDDELEEIVKSKQAWNMVPGLLQGSCDYPLGHFADYARSLEFDSDPDYEYWRRAFWTVDNPTAPLPESDPLYDPDDDSEQLPRNMMFITEGPGGRVLHYKLPPKPNAGRMYSTFSSDETCIPVSDGWSGPYTMLERDTLDNELGIVRQYVDLITEPPTTTRPYLDGQCAPEEMRDFEDPLPFKRVEERRDRGVVAKRSDAGNGEAEKAGTKDSAEEGDEAKEGRPGAKEAKESVTDEENEEGVNSENRKQGSK
uniref:N/A n=1 Tax=Ganoderma boninense TaxID=34458 RepID=A0A5K1JT43_9APHY|nr:N/A [Ganoderma boninense]